MRTVLGSSSTTKTSGERSCACITKSPTLSAVDFPHTGPLGLQTVPHGKTGVDLLIGCLPTFINLSSGQEWVVASLGAAALVAMSVEENDRMIRTRCWVTGVVNEAEGSGYSYRKNGGCWRCRVHRPVPGLPLHAGCSRVWTKRCFRISGAIGLFLPAPIVHLFSALKSFWRSLSIDWRQTSGARPAAVAASPSGHRPFATFLAATP